MTKQTKEYLGDGVYVDNDGYQLILTAENGIVSLHTIYLDPSVYSALLRYVDGMRKTEDKDTEAAA